MLGLLPAVERVFEYLPGSGVPGERARSTPYDEKLLASDWPAAGAIEFRDVRLRYADGLPLALAGLELSVAGGEKLGVVGRTGAGKSTVLVALFRLVEPCGGSVLVDGTDVGRVGLKALRSSLAMIPQEAVLIEGTAGENLDPFGVFDRAELESVLVKVGLPPKLIDSQVGAAGEQLSVGERQLVAIARILLRKVTRTPPLFFFFAACFADWVRPASQSKVVVMDEPTAHIDPETDARVQQMVRVEFAQATLITVAHRLHTIADFDRVLVMDVGRAAECDTPSELLRKPGGIFADMVRALGSEAASAICDKANTKAEFVSFADEDGKGDCGPSCF